MAAALRTPRRRQEVNAQALAPRNVNARTEPETGSHTNVIVADPQGPFREGVRASLGYGFAVVGQAASVAELAHVSATTDATLVLVDQTLPGGGLAAALHVVPPAAKVVVFANDANDDQAIEALRLGVSGYLLKDIPSSRLASTLRAVMDGEPALDASLIRALMNEIARPDRAAQLSVTGGTRVLLTSREKEVALLLRDGRSTSAIAAELAISAVTVRRHISDLMRKLRVGTRAAVIELLAG
jgi:two-component system, NarL family, nitrate/nitrite response regulator NarL